MFETKNDLSPTIREKAVGLLNARLADCIDLHTQVKHAHWNVKGPNFIALHKLFDEINDAVMEYVDDIAERAVQLGGVAHGTVRSVAGRSTLAEYPAAAVGRPGTRRGAVRRPWPPSARRRGRGSIRPMISATSTPRTCSPRCRAGSTNGSGSWRRTAQSKR